MYTLTWTAHFTRSAKKFAKRHPELKKKVAAILRDLEKDPFHPHLEYHQLGGKQAGVQAVSLTYSCRITLTLMVTEKEIILLDIGSHDEVYK
jgi:mRNA-degrading endonuclease YafQ of YafQ-DinJ toxin-antitoxin module